MSDSHDPRNFLIRREGDTGMEVHGYTNRETYNLWSYMLEDLDTFLLDFVDLPRTPAERAEELEQLRALEHGHRIRVAVVEGWRSAPVDVPSDLDRVERLLAES